jgi:hypothetical protein
MLYASVCSEVELWQISCEQLEARRFEVLLYLLLHAELHMLPETDALHSCATFCLLSSQDGNERDYSATHVFYGELYACVNHPKLSEQQFRQLTHAIVDAERSSAAADKAALAGTYSIEMYAAMEARAALTVWQLVIS